MRIVLASKSPRRRKMLTELGIDYEMWDGEVNEEIEGKLSPYETVECLAEKKCLEATKQIDDENALVIAADTVVALGDEILGKPSDDDDARRMLKNMSGSYHEVYTGIAVSYSGVCIKSYEKTEIEFRNITDKEIERYIKTGEHKDKAGSYGIQEKGGYFVKSIHGDINNVVGLPVLLIRNVIFDNFKIDIFDM